MPHAESLMMAEVRSLDPYSPLGALLTKQHFDKIRAQGGYKYHKGLERVPL
jgi:hypothetical protein